jgi:hypothetical protein
MATCWYAVMGITVAETIRPQAQIAGEKISSNGLARSLRWGMEHIIIFESNAEIR